MIKSTLLSTTAALPKSPQVKLGQADGIKAAPVALPSGMERNRLLDSAQSAALFGYSLAHFRRLYKAGKVPSPIQINNHKMGWPAGVLLDFLAERQSAA